jgi:hypothetical protein
MAGSSQTHPGLGRKPLPAPGYCREGGEVPCPVGFSTRGARRRTHQYVEHPEARKHRWVRHVAGRSRYSVRSAG